MLSIAVLFGSIRREANERKVVDSQWRTRLNRRTDWVLVAALKEGC